MLLRAPTTQPASWRVKPDFPPVFLQDRVSRSSGITSAGSSRDGGSDSGGFDMLSAAEWPGVPHAAVLLSPGQCRGLWRQFLSDSNFVVQQVL